MLEIYWHCLDLADPHKQFVAESLFELSQALKRPPVEIEFQAVSLPAGAAKGVEDKLRNPPADADDRFVECAHATVHELLKLGDRFRLLIYCSPSSAVAQVAQAENPNACWGASLRGFFSAVYDLGNKPILWHETLHLLNAEDCYDDRNPSVPTGCELGDRCIMQWAPTSRTINEWPFLCTRNVKLIHKSVWKTTDAGHRP